MTIPQNGTYQLDIRALTNYGYKEQHLYVNDVYVTNMTFQANSNYFISNQGNILLTTGQNKLSIVKNWGWMSIDKEVTSQIMVYPNPSLLSSF